jgi:hypothetical protein
LTLAILAFAATPASAQQAHVLISTFNGSGEAPAALGEFNSGIAVDSSAGGEGDVYVADRAHNVIDKFDEKGKYLSQIDGSQTVQKSFAFGYEVSLAIDPSDGSLYVSDDGHGVVDKFESSGGADSGFGEKGQISMMNITEGQLGSLSKGRPFSPRGLAVDPESGPENGDLYVGDTANDVIDVFTAAGVYVRQFPSNGPAFALAFDSHGNLFAAEEESGAYVYVAATGALNHAYGSGTGLLSAGHFFGVAVDPNSNDVYLAEVHSYQDYHLLQFDDGGTLIWSVASDYGLGVAIGKANDHVYLADTEPPLVAIYGPQVTLPGASTEPASEVEATSAVLNGAVEPEGVALKAGSSEGCFFEYGETTSYGHVAPCEAPDAAEIGSRAEKVHAKITIAPDTAYHFRLVAANPSGAGYGLDMDFPTVEADAVHTIDGEGKISVSGTLDPNGADTHYHFEFITEAQFEKGEWAASLSTPEADAGAGAMPGLVSAEAPVLAPDTAYRFRLSAESTALPGGSAHSPAKVIPALATEESLSGASQAGVCPNEAERSGPSARLPDCRAYEQVTPAEKEGAQDNFDYGENNQQTVVGLDGEHFLMTTISKWGQNVSGGGETNYLFHRTTEGWLMSSLSPQPQTGGIENSLGDPFLTPDLSQFLLERFEAVSVNSNSPSVEFAVGPAGGPYTTVASEPQTPVHLHGGGSDERTHEGHWVAQSRDGAVAVIESPDHELIPGHVTATTEGDDLYKYSGGHLSQLNVGTGACGARMVQGREGGGEEGLGQGSEIANGGGPTGSINAISEDGSRVFFYAFPSGCPTAAELHNQRGPKTHLYVNTDGTQTLDLGTYRFEGANPEGTSLFLSRENGTTLEFLSYDTETQVATHLFSIEGALNAHGESGINAIALKHALSEDGNVFYFDTAAVLTPEATPQSEARNLYRYDIPTKTMTYIAAATEDGGFGGGYYTDPEGRDFYWDSRYVVDVKGGVAIGNKQVYRYDSAEDVVQCVACASPYDPEPRRTSAFMPSNGPDLSRHAPLGLPASANGDYVFFDTTAALVPNDINGEIEGSGMTKNFSPSSDVYEWRRKGIAGCALIQGCLSLITSGIDGEKNILLGTDPSGRDVFFATHSQLVPRDKDSQADVYDARIGGGFPPPASRPAECEGDACSTPMAFPPLLTPATLTLTSSGNIAGESAPPAVSKPKSKPKTKRACKARAKKKCKKKSRKKGRRARDRRTRS